MKIFLVSFVGLALLLSTFTGSVFSQTERDAVVFIDGCTAFVVDGNYLVTAKHCEHAKQVKVTIQDTPAIANKVFTSSGEDGPVVFRLTGGPYHSLPLASGPPNIGEEIYSLGYPGGNWARIEGKLIGGNGVDLNYTNHRVATGNSGGPLLNSKGQVIGIALHVDPNIAVHQSGFAGWRVTSEAISQAKGGKASAPAGKSTVVVFSSPQCSPCRDLKRDYDTGYFAEYDFQFVEYEDGRWSDPALYKEFWNTAKPRDDLTFPTIWVRGTNQYKVGYDARRRGGLLGWIRGALKMLIGGVIGERQKPQLPVPADPPIPVPQLEPAPDFQPLPDLKGTEVVPESATKTSVDKLIADLKALKDEALKTKADLDKFKDSGVIGKIKGMAALKSDKKELMSKVEAVQNGVMSLKSDFDGNPIQMLWGLFGVISGLVQRRFLGGAA